MPDTPSKMAMRAAGALTDAMIVDSDDDLVWTDADIDDIATLIDEQTGVAELLEALQRLLRSYEADYEQVPTQDVATSFATNSQAIEQARAAIAKATQ